MQLQESLNIAKGLGRFEDDHIAHVATGETVVPRGILEANPELRKMLYDQFREFQVNPEEFVVGSPAMKINPITGQPEFFVGKLLKKVTKGLESFADKSGLKSLGKKLAPLAPIAATFIPGGAAISGLAGAGLKGLLEGKKPKEYLADAAKGGAIGALAQGMTKGFTKEGMFTPGTSVGMDIVEGIKSGGIEGLKNQLISEDSPLGKFLASPLGKEIGGRLKLQGLGDTLEDATKGVLGGNTAAAIFGGGMGTGGGMGGLGGLASLALLKNILNQPDRSPADIVPMGASAFGYTPEQLENIPSYRIANLQPALVKGAQYANMEEGGLLEGIASIKQNGNIKGYEKGGMDDDGPGDITPAFLEPGEFVMTRPATRALGADNLYRLMKMAESVA